MTSCVAPAGGVNSVKLKPAGILSLMTRKTVPFFRAVLRQNRAAEYWDEIGLTMEQYKRLFDFKYKRAIEAIRKGEAGNLAVFETYEMTPFTQFPRDDKELTAIEWGVGCLACRSMMGIELDGTIYPVSYTHLTLPTTPYV